MLLILMNVMMVVYTLIQVEELIMDLLEMAIVSWSLVIETLLKAINRIMILKV